MEENLRLLSLEIERVRKRKGSLYVVDMKMWGKGKIEELHVVQRGWNRNMLEVLKGVPREFQLLL